MEMLITCGKLASDSLSPRASSSALSSWRLTWGGTLRTRSVSSVLIYNLTKFQFREKGWVSRSITADDDARRLGFIPSPDAWILNFASLFLSISLLLLRYSFLRYGEPSRCDATFGWLRWRTECHFTPELGDTVTQYIFSSP